MSGSAASQHQADYHLLRKTELLPGPDVLRAFCARARHMQVIAYSLMERHSMRGLIAFLLAAPKWPYLVLALIVWFGIRALKPRTTPIWRLAAIPAVFIAWGTASLFLRANMSGFAIFEWIAAAATGAWLGCQSTNFQIDCARGVVTFPGSVRPLLRYLLIFSIKYALAVTNVLWPAYRAEASILNIIFSGAFAGYFGGWLWMVLQSYRLGRLRGPQEKNSRPSSLASAPN
jgi:hypothetical protein